MESQTFHRRVGKQTDLILRLELGVNKMECRLPGLFEPDAVVKGEIEEQEEFARQQDLGWRDRSGDNLRLHHLFWRGQRNDMLFRTPLASACGRYRRRKNRPS